MSKKVNNFINTPPPFSEKSINFIVEYFSIKKIIKKKERKMRIILTFFYNN